MTIQQITADQREQQYIAELDDAREILQVLKNAYKEHATGRGFTKRYKIKDREMEFVDLADLLKQIRYWENEVRKFEAALGFSARRSGRIICRF